jgi:dTDP-4-amino-4,6-dideoxygalactose transaminase
MSAEQLGRRLAREGVETRHYYSPPVHTMQAYRPLGSMNGTLPVTARVSEMTLTLPLWNGMSDAQVELVGRAIEMGRSESRPSRESLSPA